MNLPAATFLPTQDELEILYPIAAQLQKPNKIWALWLAGRGVVNGNIEAFTGGGLERLILPHPDGHYLRVIQESLDRDDNMTNLTADVRKATEIAKRNHIPVKWYPDYPGFSLLIGNPRQNSGWVHIQLLVPHVLAQHRQTFRLEAKKAHDEVERLIVAYEKMWSAAKEPD